MCWLILWHQSCVEGINLVNCVPSYSKDPGLRPIGQSGQVTPPLCPSQHLRVLATVSHLASSTVTKIFHGEYNVIGSEQDLFNMEKASTKA